MLTPWSISALTIGPWRQHFHDESWRGSGYAFLAESTFCVSYSVILGKTTNSSTQVDKVLAAMGISEKLNVGTLPVA